MFRPLRLAVVAAFSIVIASPPAYANKWLAWLEELSGPGAFEGPIRWGVEVGCLTSPVTTVELMALLAATAAEVSGASSDDVSRTYDAVRLEIGESEGSNDEAKVEHLLAGLDALRDPAQTNAQLADAYTKKTGRTTETTKQALTWLLDVIPVSFDKATLSGARAQAATALPVAGLPYKFVARFRENLSRFSRCAVDRSNNLITIQIEAAWLTDTLKDERADGGYPGYTRATTVSAIGYVPIGRVLPLIVGSAGRWSREVPAWGRFIELGTGVGTIGLSGTAIEYPDQWRLTLPMRVRVLPSEIFWSLAECGKKPGSHRSSRVPTEASAADKIRRALQSLQYHYGADLIFGRINSGVYSDLGPAAETLSNEIVRSHGVTIDIGTLIRARAGR